MGKVIFWIVVIFGVLFVLRLVNVGKARRRAESDAAARRGAPPAETMVRCTACGVFLPQGEAKPVGEGFVCRDPACIARR